MTIHTNRNCMCMWKQERCGIKCERKILAGKKYEKCNKFYYYDVSTSLHNLHFPRVTLLDGMKHTWLGNDFSGACGAKVKGCNFRVNCLITKSICVRGLNCCHFKLHLLFHNLCCKERLQVE